jgi:hypothetical protein
MASDHLAAAILLALVLIGILSTLGASAMAFGHDSASDDPRAGLSPWR